MLLLCFFNTSIAQNMIPKPNSYITSNDNFEWNNDIAVYVKASRNDARQLKNYIKDVFGLNKFLVGLPKPLFSSNKHTSFTNPGKLLSLVCTSKTKPIRGELLTQYQQGYNIKISTTRIDVTAPTACGLFYALQTLRQLIVNGKLKCATIADSPRFMYRGYHLDCSRHFWTKDFIKKQLDAMAYFKMNVFHWHLVDGGGWRMEVKKYPLLVQETAYRTQSSWDRWWMDKDRHYAHKADKGAYGGYYTQEDIKEVVRYAAERHIEVLPEIELPGHSDEVCFAYPELSCAKKPYVNSDLCVGNEATYVFAENVLKEVMDLFPSKFIHIGGDEADRSAWEKCPLCQQKMQEHKLKNTAELQSYFTHRIELFLNKHGRTLMGWDEIVEGKLAPNAGVMSWRGEQNGIEAAKLGHPVVMTPVSYCYIDMYQDAPMKEPKAQGGIIPLRKIYSYDPLPITLRGTEGEKSILGLQACLWTENIETPAHVEYMTYPRLLAIAETGWVKQKETYDNFCIRAITAIDTLQQWGYNTFNLRKESGVRVESLKGVKHKALGAKVTYIAPFAEKYRADDSVTLTDGKRGDWGYLEGRWQGFIKDGVDVVIDLGDEQDITTVKADFLQIDPVWIYTPSAIQLSVSSDNKQFTVLDKVDPQIPRKKDYTIYTYQWKGGVKGRYLRLRATTNIDGGWIFTDEIRVNEY